MIQTFRDGIDLHQQTASELFGVPLDLVTKQQRAAAKTINFGVLYGMSAHGLSVATGMDGKEAAAFIQRYFEVRPKLKDYIEATKTFAWEHQYTKRYSAGDAHARKSERIIFNYAKQPREWP